MSPPRRRLTREGIVDEARALVASEGLRALSLRRLAARLEVTAPALYLHFAAKDELLAAVAEVEFSRLIAQLELAGRGAGRDPLDQIKAQSHAYVQYAVANPALFEVLFVFRPAWTPGPGGDEFPLASKAFAIPAAVVEDAIAAGLLRERDPLLASLTIWSAVHGVAMLLQARPGFGDAYEAALVDTVVAGIVDGLSASPRPEGGDG